MIIFLIILLIICLWGLKKRKNEDYLSKEQTGNIRGIFAMIIFFSHLKQYLVLNTGLDSLYSTVLGYIGQLMVVIFFFYSGYGIVLSFDNRPDYFRTFPKNRILKTWFHFVVAVSVYLAIDFILSINYPISTILMSYIGWDAIGNSNWFIFDTLILYIGCLLSFLFVNRYTKKNRVLLFTIVTTLMTAVMILGLRAFKPSWWYDTLLGFPAGMYYYLYKNKIDYFLDNKIRYWLFALATIIVFVVSYLINNALSYNIAAIAFCLIICLITFKIQVGNKILDWLGKYSFYIYIYMRLPMLVLQHFGFDKHIYLFSGLSLVITLILAGGFGKIQNTLDKALLGRSK